jgi:hypothetical protein
MIRIYRRIQILLNSSNDIFREYFFLVLNNILIVIAVLCNYVLIRFHKWLGLAEMLSFGMLTLACKLSICIIYFKLGSMNDKSIKLVAAWKAKFSRKKSHGQNIAIGKSLESLSPLKVEMSSFGCYKKKTSVRIIGKLFFYTTKSLIMTRKIFLD